MKSQRSKARVGVNLKLSENLPDIFDTTAILNFNLENELDDIAENVEVDHLNRPAYTITIDDDVGGGGGFDWMPMEGHYDYETDMFGFSEPFVLPQPPLIGAVEARVQPRISAIMTESLLDAPHLLETTAAPVTITSSVVKEATNITARVIILKY